MSTASFGSYSIKQTTVVPYVSRDCHLVVDDYKGQNAGTLTEALTKAAANGEGAPDYSAIVLVVDLFPAESMNDTPRQAGTHWDATRVKFNLDQWEDVAYDLVRGFAPNANYICLFINKVDLIEPRSHAVESSIKAAYSELIERMEVRARGAEFNVLVGSVGSRSMTDDINVMALFADLVRTAKLISQE